MSWSTDHARKTYSVPHWAEGYFDVDAAGHVVVSPGGAGPSISLPEVVDSARASAQPLTGTLRLGVIPTIAPFLLPAVLPAVRATYPRLRLLLREDQTAPSLSTAQLLGNAPRTENDQFAVPPVIE